MRPAWSGPTWTRHRRRTRSVSHGRAPTATWIKFHAETGGDTEKTTVWPHKQIEVRANGVCGWDHHFPLVIKLAR